MSDALFDLRSSDSGLGRLIGYFLAVVVIAVIVFELLWISAFYVGLTPVLGVEKGQARSFGAGSMFSVIGASNWHVPLGTKIFYAKAGQKLVIDYDSEAKKGAIWFILRKLPAPKIVDSAKSCDSHNGSAELTIPSSGFYRLHIEPTVICGNKGGYDLSWDVSWGLR